MNFKNPYIVLYDDGIEITTTKNPLLFAKREDPEILVIQDFYKMSDGTVKDAMIVDTVNGEALYHSLEEALEAEAEYRNGTIEELCEEKEANYDILKNYKNKSETEVLKEVKKVFDFVGNEGTEKFLKFVKLSPLDEGLQSQINILKQKGEEIKKQKEEDEKILENLKEEIKLTYGDKVKTFILGNPALEVNFKGMKWIDDYGNDRDEITLTIWIEDDKLVAKFYNEAQQEVGSPEDIYKFAKEMHSRMKGIEYDK